MAIINSCSNAFKTYIMDAIKTHDFKIALMVPMYAFDKDTDAGWANVSTHEIAAGFGYTAGGQLLTGATLAQDDALDKGVLSFDFVRWDAVGGDIPETGSAIIYDDTHAGKLIVGCSDFDVNYLTESGKFFKFITVQILVA